MTNYLLLFILYALFENDETFFIHIVFFQIVMVNRKVKYTGTYIDLLSKKTLGKATKMIQKWKNWGCYVHIENFEKGLSRDHQVTVKNFPGGTTEKVLKEIEDLVADKPDCVIIHAGTNNITNGINSLNSIKKIVKDVKKSSPNK